MKLKQNAAYISFISKCGQFKPFFMFSLIILVVSYVTVFQIFCDASISLWAYVPFSTWMKGKTVKGKNRKA